MGVDGPILLTQSISITAATRPQLPGGPGLPKNCPIFPAFRLRPPAWGEGDKTQRQNCPHPSTNILSEKSDNGLTYKTLSSQIWSLFSSLAFVSLRWWMIFHWGGGWLTLALTKPSTTMCPTDLTVVSGKLDRSLNLKFCLELTWTSSLQPVKGKVPPGGKRGSKLENRNDFRWFALSGWIEVDDWKR